ncbi:hypothetical protein PICSAR64_04377 [Mycobacterium avium subsp. paratuberculosis]|nr:hypothetical protein PICSAR64_04377 [Mycobacterium avium subsp. paratuberculosis]
MPGPGQQQQDVALGNGGVVQGQRPGDGAGQDLAGGVVAQRLLDPQRHPGQVVVDGRQLVGVLVAPKRGIGKQFGGGLVTGDHHQEHEPEHLVVGEPIAVDLGLQQRRRQVPGGLLAPLLDHPLVIDDEVERGLDRLRRHVGDPLLAVHHAVGPGPHLNSIGLGHTHQLGDDVHGQLAGEFVDIVDGAAGRRARLVQHGVEVLGGDLGDPGLQFANPPGREPLRDQRAQPQMGGVVHRQERHRLGGVRAAGRRVQRDAVLVGKRCAVAESLQHVLMPGQRPELQFVVAVQGGLIAKPLVVRVGVFVEVVIVGIEHQLVVAHMDGHRVSPASVSGLACVVPVRMSRTT